MYNNHIKGKEKQKMTKNFYEKNYASFIPVIRQCECKDFRFCHNLCPIRDACEYYYTNNDEKFDKEEE